MLEEIEKLLARNHFCVLATVSEKGLPQSTGVIYCSKGFDLYIYTEPQSKKARNISRNPKVSVTVPVWDRKPFWTPPRCIQFQGVADLLPIDDERANEAYRFRVLSMTVKAGSYETKGCFIHVRPSRRVNTYGVGVPRMTMARHPERAIKDTPLPAMSLGGPSPMTPATARVLGPRGRVRTLGRVRA